MRSIVGVVFVALAGLGFMAVLFDGIYIVDEGHVGVKTRWGKAVGQEMPSGVQFKMPIATSIHEFDVRERRLTAEMAAATANQLPITSTVSMSWRLDPQRVLETYVQYGTPQQFESVVLQPRLQQWAKAGLSEFQAGELIRDRTEASVHTFGLISDALVDYPALVLSLQIENITLPQRYLEAVMLKEEARENAEREEYNLDRQKVEAQQQVQTAEAERDAEIARTDGAAYRIREEAKANADSVRLAGQAEADAIKVVQDALQGDPLLVDYERAKRWDGRMPLTILGESPELLMELPGQQQ